MKKVSITDKSRHSLCVQPTFLMGTYNEDDSPNFAPITWVSVTHDTDHFLLVVSMSGSKKTKENVARTGYISANLVSTDMLELLDYFGSCSGLEQVKNAVTYEYEQAVAVHAPILADSKWVYECKITQTVPTGNSTTYFCEIVNVQVIEALKDVNVPDLLMLDPVVYSGDYFTVGKRLGTIGDFYKQPK